MGIAENKALARNAVKNIKPVIPSSIAWRIQNVTNIINTVLTAMQITIILIDKFLQQRKRYNKGTPIIE